MAYTSKGDMLKSVYDTDGDGVINESALPAVEFSDTDFAGSGTTLDPYTVKSGPIINAATAKTTPVDADYVGLMDSAASNVLKKLSWANIKATLKTHFDTLYAVLASPTLTGTPLSTTAAVDTNTTQIATTAFVIAQAGAATPIIDGTATVGTSTRFARADHIHPTDTTRAALASPTFTGTPAAPTASAATNTTQIATTAFVFAERTNSATLTNKTLTTPVISSISNTGTLTLPTSTDTLIGKATTDTLTNKRWTARVGTTTSSATPTINTDNTDIYKLTAQTADITSFTTNLSGTPVDGDILEIQVTGTAARAITWGASFVSSTVTLPTTTVTTATLSVVFQFFTTSSYGTSKWVCVNSF